MEGISRYMVRLCPVCHRQCLSTAEHSACVVCHGVRLSGLRRIAALAEQVGGTSCPEGYGNSGSGTQEYTGANPHHQNPRLLSLGARWRRMDHHD